MTAQLSVLVPVYNTEKYLAEALGSVLAQTFRDFELVVIDDGSTDSSPKILAELARADGRVRVISRPNRGLVGTRNQLLEEAQTEFVAWMDSDDVSRPERLALQMARFRANPALVCVGGFAQRIDPAGSRLAIEEFPTSHEDIVRAQTTGGAMRFPTVMMRTEVARRVGGFRGPFPIGEDFDLLLRMSELGRMENLTDIVLDYRQHTGSTTESQNLRWQYYRDVILDLARERRETGSDRIQRGEPWDVAEFVGTVSRPRPLSAIHADWANEAVLYGNMQSAWKHSLRALRLAPLSVQSWRILARVARGQLGAEKRRRA